MICVSLVWLEIAMLRNKLLFKHNFEILNESHYSTIDGITILYASVGNRLLVKTNDFDKMCLDFRMKNMLQWGVKIC
jgi:hypothetical protein